MHRIMVSTPTRPEGRVLRSRVRGITMPWSRFNPHPARRPVATPRVGQGIDAAVGVSILTRPEGRVLHRAGCPTAP